MFSAMFSRLSFWSGVASALFCVATASAQPVPSRDPTSTHIFPAGGQRGTKVTVRVGAECLPPGANLFVLGEGVKVPLTLGTLVADHGEPSPRRKPTEIPVSYPKQWRSEMTISEAAPLGTIFWRIGCAQGGTQSRPFVIGELPEFIESESNSTSDRAEAITLPVTINGQIHGERDLDYFRFTATRGQVVVCEVLARRLGSRLDPIVEILDSDARRLPVQAVYRGSDPILALRVEQDGEYLIRMANVSFRGDPSYVYRVNVTTSATAQFAFPSSGQAGTEQEVELYQLSGDTDWKVVRKRIAFPETPEAFLWTDPQSAANGIKLASLPHPHRREQEPNELPAQSTPLSVPGSASGQFLTARDTDWFEFVAQQGQLYTVACSALPAQAVAFPGLQLTDTAGKVLVQARSVESSSSSCRVDWKAPSDGVFRIRLRDLRFGARGGPEFIYRLSVAPAAPDFTLALGADSVSVLQGSGLELAVDVVRTGGFSGAVKLALLETPEGVTAEPVEVPAGSNSGKLKIQASDQAMATSYALQVIGTSQIAGGEVTRQAHAPHLGRDGEGVSIGAATIPVLNLTVRHPPVFRLYCSEAYLYAHRGSVFPYPMTVERLGDFQGEIFFQTGDRQNRDLDGVRMLDFTLPQEEVEFHMPIYLPETMHINVQSQSQLYTQAYASFIDKHGRPQSFLVVSEKRNMLRTLPPVVKLIAATPRIVMGAENVLRCHLKLKRTSNLTGPMRIELVDPPQDLPLQIEPTFIQAGQTDVVIPLRLTEVVMPSREFQLTFRATGKMESGVDIISEVTVLLESP